MADAIQRPLHVEASSGMVPGGGVATMYQIFRTEPVNGNVDVDSLGPGLVGLNIHEHRSFGLWVKLAGAGPDVDIQILQAPTDVAANYVVPVSSGTVIAGITDTTARCEAVSPVAMPFLRFRLKGNAANGADTTADLYFWMQS